MHIQHFQHVYFDACLWLAWLKWEECLQREMTSEADAAFEEHASGSGPLDHWTTHSTHWVCIDLMDRQLSKVWYMRQGLDHWTSGPHIHSLSLYWLYAYTHNIRLHAHSGVALYDLVIYLKISMFLSMLLIKVCTDLMHTHTKSGCSCTISQSAVTLSRPECLWLYVCFIHAADVNSAHLSTQRYLRHVVLSLSLSLCLCVSMQLLRQRLYFCALCMYVSRRPICFVFFAWTQQ